ncbi:hypothetical protein MNBD_GAMMA05-972 [hydrothermal vent metagenome]|uniref:Uncharacterized protein n=1 Tax=hydrothermal vent metagenome TaxID=652676 RepID=A0A3B0W5B8_9ZZZZ
MEEVIIASDALDVPTDNYEEFDQEIDPAKLGDKLTQINRFKGTCREYQRYAYNYLLLNFIEKKNKVEKNYRINLAWLSSKPTHNKVIVWKWMVFTLLSTLLTGSSFYLMIEKTFNPDYCLIAGIITLSATLIFLLIFIYCMRDEYIFNSYFGGAKLFLIENKKPEQQSFDIFFIKLQQAIEQAQSALSTSDRLIGELKMCRRLRDEGIINDESYTLVRTAIFKHQQYKA